MSETLSQQLKGACQSRNLAWWGTADSSARTAVGRGHRLVGPFWACAYEPTTGTIAAFVSGAPGWKAAKRRLLRAIESGSPPAVEWRRDGLVTRRIESHVLIVEFSDGLTGELAYPYSNRSIVPGTRVSVVKLAADPEPLILWGPEHFPRRESARPLAETTQGLYAYLLTLLKAWVHRAEAQRTIAEAEHPTAGVEALASLLGVTRMQAHMLYHARFRRRF